MKKGEELSGLLITGIVRERTRRFLTGKTPETEVVTYVIFDNNDHRYYVEDFAPESYHDVGDSVTIPIYVKPYKKKNGDLSYTLCAQKNYHPSRGEAF